MIRSRRTIQYDPETDTLNGSTGGEEPRILTGITMHRALTLEDFHGLQVAVYVMVGGGLLGALYATQPTDASLDDRAGRRPYHDDEIETVRQVMIAACHALGLDPHRIPMPRLPGCWVF